MFNRQPYNRGKFNVSGGSVIGNSGLGMMLLLSTTTKVEKIISANAITNMSMKNLADATRVKFDIGLTDMKLNGFCDGTKSFIVDANTSNMVMITNAEQQLAGESVIDLKGIILKPGDELIINTCDMTININGQNAMHYFTSDSDFFSLLSGKNYIIYTDTNGSRKVSFDVIWKDRWL